MIFVTVGTQLTFDRLISAVDEWAGGAPEIGVFAQIGPSRLRPRHIEYAPFITPSECAERMRSASAIVAHAGMGTILTGLELGKPLLVMPRLARLGEHRNDHQLATARRFAEMGRINVAQDETELAARLDHLQLASAPPITPHAPSEFLANLRAFIVGQPVPEPANSLVQPRPQDAEPAESAPAFAALGGSTA